MKKLNKFVLASGTTALTVAIHSVNVQGQENSGLETVVVTGIRQSLASANQVKRESAQVVDAISAEDIGRFPDQNIAESLQRISGVFINRQAGEGSEITVRGFGPEFNIVRLNNRTLATVAEERGFDFQVLASELVSGAEAMKSPTADMWEGGIGANVNLKTARPLDNPGFKAVGSVQGRYQDLADSIGTRASGVLSNTFLEDKIGVLASLSFEDRETRTEESFGVGGNNSIGWSLFEGTDVETGEDIKFRYPGRMGQGFTEDSRERLGAQATIQFMPSDVFEVSLDGLYIDFKRKSIERGTSAPLQFPFFTSVEVNDNGTATSFTKTNAPLDIRTGVLGGDTTTSALGINTEFNVSESFSLNSDISWSRAEAFDEQTLFNPGYRDNNPLNDPLPGGADDPNFEVNRVTWQNGDVPTWTSSLDLGDPENVRTHFQNTRGDQRTDEVFEARFDAEWEFDFGILSGISSGLFLSDREKDVLPFNTGNFVPSDPSHPDAPGNLIGNNLAPFDLTDDVIAPLEGLGRPHVAGRFFVPPAEFFQTIDNGDILSNESASFPRQILNVDFDRYCNWLVEASGNENVCSMSADEAERKNVVEKTQGLYLQSFFSGDVFSKSWAANLGFRYIETETSAFGNSVELIDITASDPDGSSSGLNYFVTPDQRVFSEKEYEHLLPSFNFKLDLSEEFLLRTALSKVITRPNLIDIVPSQSFGGNFEAAARTGSNPNLEPFEASQFDISAEYYSKDGNSFFVTFFHKELDTFISQVTTQNQTTFVHPTFGNVVLSDSGPKNREGGSVQGFEVAGIYNFDYLPGLLRNLGVQANYTYVNSRDPSANDEIQGDLITLPSTGLEGFTPNSYNIIGFYEDEKLQARLAYNWRDTFLSQRLGPSGLPAHFDEYGQLDFSMVYTVSNHVELTLEGSNILNNNTIWFQDVRERVLLNEYTGRRFFAGIRVRY